MVLISLNENFVSELKLKIIKKDDKFFDEKEEMEDICKVRSEVSEVFIQFFPYFRMYKSYISNLKESSKIVHQLEENPSFKKFLSEIDPSIRQSLDDYLIMPMQRIPSKK